MVKRGNAEGTPKKAEGEGQEIFESPSRPILTEQPAVIHSIVE
jgi:hypothetical protein